VVDDDAIAMLAKSLKSTPRLRKMLKRLVS
jgi:hypothetical protein